ncbi:MAG: ribulose-phosphate 3-epimerase [Eubacterium sp.]|jgi:ribulose-phosphate 3-epimerase|nr:ribulose-phosphate 3-epimerase [Eubacterium sp.]MCH4006726.1 ribulose-phosphate 3-epimerase [Eubacterium sp.]MCH4046981.1 ribulose-phosphate 3-epimerase [Eubacterium sp.]MCH4080078.1 ribulose-phosphate 3-epimerase [Eubacterium sp.]MCH4109880.1 ribulose-phosphate 3-epimerase [Eubacterium sp.]
MKRKGQIAASMMCAGIDKIFYYLTEFKEAKLEFLHVDIMDGQFVPNFALGTDYVKSLRRVSDIPLDYHFLVMNPLEKMSWFDIREGDHVAFHYEHNENIPECLQFLKRIGAASFVAINPETDYHVLDPYLDDMDGVLVMTVHPGFAGKKLVRSTIEKVKEMKDYFVSTGRDDLMIEVDGNISIKNAEIFYNCGADIFVAGSSSLFKKCELSTEEIIREERKVIGWDIE